MALEYRVEPDVTINQRNTPITEHQFIFTVNQPKLSDISFICSKQCITPYTRMAARKDNRANLKTNKLVGISYLDI